MNHKDQYKSKGLKNLTLDQYITKSSEMRKDNFSAGRGDVNQNAKKYTQKAKTPPKPFKGRQIPNSKNAANGQLNTDLSEIKAQLSGLTGMMTNFLDCFNKVDERVAMNEHAIATVNQTVTKKLNFHDQRAINMKMEIQGVSFESDDNIRTAVHRFIHELGIEIQLSEIIHAYNVKKRNRDEWQTITIVVFTHEMIKERVMKQKLGMGLNAETKVYFNNVLTHANSMIQREGRKLQKDKKIFKIGFMNGKNYVIPNQGSSRVWIESIDDLNSLVASTNQNMNDQVHCARTTNKPTDIDSPGMEEYMDQDFNTQCTSNQANERDRQRKNIGVVDVIYDEDNKTQTS